MGDGLLAGNAVIAKLEPSHAGCVKPQTKGNDSLQRNPISSPYTTNPSKPTIAYRIDVYPSPKTGK